MKKFTAALALALVLAVAATPRHANAGTIEMPGVTGTIEMPGVTGTIEMPGAQPTPTPKEEETTDPIASESLWDWFAGLLTGN